MASSPPASYPHQGRHLFFTAKAAKPGCRLMRVFCAFAAFAGAALAARLFLTAQNPAGLLPALTSLTERPGFFALIGCAALPAALAAGALVLWRRAIIQAGTIRVLQCHIADYQRHAAQPAPDKAANSGAAGSGDSGYDLRPALDKLPFPLWLRDQDGALCFANQACQKLAAGQNSAETGEQAGARPAAPDIEALFSPALRQALAEARQHKRDYSGQSNIILQGNRHIFACHSFYEAESRNFITIAEDVTEKRHWQEENKRIQQGYAETFDRLSTSVAIFDPAQKLEFFNSAFAALWPLETAFLESRPSHALLLDRLREKGILNERPDWRQWKEELFEAYRALSPQHYIWNLPDGRTLRVVANPHPQGGVTWLFDDLTEKLTLQARYNTLIRMQGEVLDNLSEGVAVFGPDGRLRLANPAFSQLWHLPADLAIEGTHIEKIKSFCRQQEARSNFVPRKIVDFSDKDTKSIENPERATGTENQEAGSNFAPGKIAGFSDQETQAQASAKSAAEQQTEEAANSATAAGPGYQAGSRDKPAADAPNNNAADAVWQKLALYVTGFVDKRDFVQGRTETHSAAARRIFDYMLVPLPQGQTMLTFVDVTDSVHIARALHERNSALESADKLRNDFVQHVSYELRTPLTNIMGFTDLLLSPVFGSLDNRQSGYLRNIAGQSVLLFNLVNDILDLATVDAGIMELNIGPVAVAKVMDYAAERVKTGLEEKHITLDRHIAAGLTRFDADEARIRQIFVHLLNNAVTAAPPYSHIRFSAEKYNNYIAFSVADEGPGIPPEHLESIFKRFTSYAYEGRKSGIGLGLSIVKNFVELHQGHVVAESSGRKGTKLICRFPFHNNALEQG